MDRTVSFGGVGLTMRLNLAGGLPAAAQAETTALNVERIFGAKRVLQARPKAQRKWKVG